MRILTVINAKGGCGKSTIAMNLAAGLAMRGAKTLLIDMDPQAQVTQWLTLGDGLTDAGTLVTAIEGKVNLDEVIQSTQIENLSFIASSEGLEQLGRQITEVDGYQSLLTHCLAGSKRDFDLVIIDSPNQISPIMENAVFPSDVFVVPFESTKAVRSYANFYKLLMRIRGDEQHRLLHVLSNLSRQNGLRRKVIEAMKQHAIPRARTEVRTCGWLAQVDEHGGSIFHWRPHAKGAIDMAALLDEVLELLAMEDSAVAAFIRPVLVPADDATASPSAGKGMPIAEVTEPQAVNESHQHGKAA